MAGYLGASPVPQTIQKKQSFTATASQTTFTTTGYTDGQFINVYLNGVRLINGTDYTATNGSDIVLTTGASASDVLDFETFNEFTLVDQTLETPTFRTSATLKNDTHEDTDGGRESTLIFKGEQSGGEISTLAEIQASHDGTADDEKADLIFRTNDGSDGSSPTTAMIINSDQNVGIGGSPVPSSTGYNRAALHLQQPVTSSGSQIKFSNGTSGHTATDGGHISYWSDSNFYYNNLENSGRHRFYATNSSGTSAERVSIDSDGLKFNGDTAAANALSDSEEGTWTPAIAQGYSSPTYSHQVGIYTKIGNVIKAYFRLDLDTGSSQTSGIEISGLPYTSLDNSHVYHTGTQYLNGGGGKGEHLRLLVFPNNTRIYLYHQDDTGVTSVTGAQVGTSLDLLGQVTYTTA